MGKIKDVLTRDLFESGQRVPKELEDWPEELLDAYPSTDEEGIEALRIVLREFGVVVRRRNIASERLPNDDNPVFIGSGVKEFDIAGVVEILVSIRSVKNGLLGTAVFAAIITGMALDEHGATGEFCATIGISVSALYAIQNFWSKVFARKNLTVLFDEFAFEDTLVLEGHHLKLSSDKPPRVVKSEIDGVLSRSSRGLLRMDAEKLSGLKREKLLGRLDKLIAELRLGLARFNTYHSLQIALDVREVSVGVKGIREKGAKLPEEVLSRQAGTFLEKKVGQGGGAIEAASGLISVLETMRSTLSVMDNTRHELAGLSEELAAKSSDRDTLLEIIAMTNNEAGLADVEAEISAVHDSLDRTVMADLAPALADVRSYLQIIKNSADVSELRGLHPELLTDAEELGGVDQVVGRGGRRAAEPVRRLPKKEKV